MGRWMSDQSCYLSVIIKQRYESEFYLCKLVFCPVLKDKMNKLKYLKLRLCKILRPKQELAVHNSENFGEISAGVLNPQRFVCLLVFLSTCESVSVFLVLTLLLCRDIYRHQAKKQSSLYYLTEMPNKPKNERKTTSRTQRKVKPYTRVQLNLSCIVKAPGGQ